MGEPVTNFEDGMRWLVATGLLEQYVAQLGDHIAEKLQATNSSAVVERTAQIAAHRACCGTEHDPVNGKLHGCCVVCGVPWPCEYAGKPPEAILG